MGDASRAVRKAEMRARMLTSYSGLDRSLPQCDRVAALEKPAWLSIRIRAVGRLKSIGFVILRM